MTVAFIKPLPVSLFHPVLSHLWHPRGYLWSFPPNDGIVATTIPKEQLEYQLKGRIEHD